MAASGRERQQPPKWHTLAAVIITLRHSLRSAPLLTPNYSNCLSLIPDNRLIDHVAQLKSDNLKLSVENEQLRSAVSTGGTGSNVAIATLEKKLLSQQEELTELHKRKGENSQMIVDLNQKVEQQRIMISEKEHR